MILCFYVKPFSHTVNYIYRALFLLIQKNCAELKQLVFVCEQVQPLSLNTMPILGLGEVLLLLTFFFFPHEQPLFPVMQNKGPLPTPKY